jgi:hypothetical protein
MVLPTNIRLGRIDLPRTNTLAYYRNKEITAVKSFIVQARVINIIIFFILSKEHKLDRFASKATNIRLRTNIASYLPQTSKPRKKLNEIVTKRQFLNFLSLSLVKRQYKLERFFLMSIYSLVYYL